MFYSSDGATQLRAAFLLSLRQNKVQRTQYHKKMKSIINNND